MVTTGGTSLKDDIMRLYNPVHILVATPGRYATLTVSFHTSCTLAVLSPLKCSPFSDRVLDLANKGVANLSGCPLFVMDEADKLLSPEFQPLIEQVINFLPRERQMLMFSATFPITGSVPVRDVSCRLLRSVCTRAKAVWQRRFCRSKCLFSFQLRAFFPFSQGVPGQIPESTV